MNPTIAAFLVIFGVVVLWMRWIQSEKKKAEAAKLLAEKLEKEAAEKAKLKLAEEAAQRQFQQLLQATKQELRGHYEKLLPWVTSALEEYQQLTNHQAGYFNNGKAVQWKAKYAKLYQDVQAVAVNTKSWQRAGMDPKLITQVFPHAELNYQHLDLAADAKQSLAQFVETTDRLENLRTAHNKAFVKQELQGQQSFFANVEGRSLDAQQRDAIVSDEDNTLVVAGAGSGKTTTIVGKVHYVLARYKVAPEQVLAISFTRKSADALTSRIKNEAVQVKTFHKLALDIISQADGSKPSVFDEEQFLGFVNGLFAKELENTTYKRSIIDFYINNNKPNNTLFEVASWAEAVELNRQYEASTSFRQKQYKNQAGKISFKQEVLKSIEERRIANWLLLHKLDYEYEANYEQRTATVTKRQYKPDFTIKQGNKIVYLEHFALDRNGDVPPFFTGSKKLSAREAYWEGINWKRQLHQDHGTTLVETFSYEMSDGSWQVALKERLEAAGLTVTPMSVDEAWELICKQGNENNAGLVRLICSIITLLKSARQTPKHLLSKGGADDYLSSRLQAMYALVQPIYEQYEAHLKSRQELDFSDMINLAADHVEQGRAVLNLRYVLVDEFQDISMPRYRLLKAILSKSLGCKLFCVGDDWQSIYRFTGSDLSLFSKFEQYFGVTYLGRIETTYRFGEPLLEVSSSFVLKNPIQLSKKLHSYHAEHQTALELLQIGGLDPAMSETDALNHVFTDIVRRGGRGPNDILILGRYTFDLNWFKELEQTDVDEKNETITHHLPSGESVQAPFMTVHKSKGLEADFVVLINCNSGKYGFPSAVADDPILSLLLSEPDPYPFGEERRLFYVALTRARKKIYILSAFQYTSAFANEIRTMVKKSGPKICPQCGSGTMQKKSSGTSRNGAAYDFFGCSNFMYGCDYTSTVYKKQVEA